MCAGSPQTVKSCTVERRASTDGRWRADGRAASWETTSPSGSPQKPLNDAQLQAKFRDCAAHAVRPLAAEVVERAMQFIRQLEEATEATELVRLFP
jgi:hypothetical protein